MPDKYLYSNAGVRTEKFFIDTSAGAADAGKGVATGPDGKLAQTLMPTGVGPATIQKPASEALSAGDQVNFWSDSGTLKVRKADASTSKPSDGYVQAAVTSGSQATVYSGGVISGLSSITPGADYWLSDTTPGGITTTAPTGNGKIQQRVGKGMSTTELACKLQDYIATVA